MKTQPICVLIIIDDQFKSSNGPIRIEKTKEWEKSAKVISALNFDYQFTETYCQREKEKLLLNILYIHTTHTQKNRDELYNAYQRSTPQTGAHESVDMITPTCETR